MASRFRVRVTTCIELKRMASIIETYLEVSLPLPLLPGLPESQNKTATLRHTESASHSRLLPSDNVLSSYPFFSNPRQHLPPSTLCQTPSPFPLLFTDYQAERRPDLCVLKTMNQRQLPRKSCRFGIVEIHTNPRKQKLMPEPGFFFGLFFDPQPFDSSCLRCFPPDPPSNTADAEIKVFSAEDSELSKVSTFNLGVGQKIAFRA